jgi:hypothetical protein
MGVVSGGERNRMTKSLPTWIGCLVRELIHGL